MIEFSFFNELEEEKELKKGFQNSLIVLVCLICGLAFVCSACKKNQADESDLNATGAILVSGEGTVYLEDASGNKLQIEPDNSIGTGDILFTGKDGTAVVSLGQGRTVYLDANTRLEFVRDGDKLDLFIVEGKILMNVQEKLKETETLTLHTAAMDIGIREAVVLVENQTQANGSGSSTFSVLKGTAEVSYTGLDNPPTNLSAGQKTVVQYQNKDKEIKINNVTDAKISQKDLAGFEDAIKIAGLTDQVRSILENTADKQPDDSQKEAAEKDKNNKNNQESAKVDNNYVPFNYSEILPVTQNDLSESKPATPVTPPTELEKEITSPVTFTSGSVTKVYDGIPLHDTTVLAAGLPKGYTYSASCSASITSIGSIENAIGDIKIFDAKGKDVTKLFTNITKTNGILEVTPAVVRVWTGSAEKIYDGTALSCEEADITGLVNGETIIVTATGSITDAGTAENTYSIDWGSANKDNYTVTEDLGTLTVEPLQLSVQWKVEDALPYAGFFYTGDAGSIDVSYLNGPHAGETISGTRVRGDGDSKKETFQCDLFTGDQIAVFTNGGGRDVGTYSVEIEAEVKNGTGSNYSITCSGGSIVITSAPLTITTGSAEKLGDGTALTCPDVSVDGLADGDTITVTPNGYLNEEGEITNTYTIAWGNTNKDNYSIIESLGTLKITYIHIIAASAEQNYNSEELKSNEYSVKNLPKGWAVTDVIVSGSQTEIGISANTITSYKLLDSSGNDVTSEYEKAVILEDGELAVTSSLSETFEVIWGAVFSRKHMKVAFPDLQLTYEIQTGKYQDARKTAEESVAETLEDIEENEPPDDDPNYDPAISMYTDLLIGQLLENDLVTGECEGAGTIDGISVDTSADTSFDPTAETSDIIYFITAGGAVISRDPAKVAFPEIGERYDLKCSYYEARTLAESLATSNNNMSDQEFQIYLRNNLKAKGWI